MSSVDLLLNQSAEWLRSTGPDSDIVMSSRIRLARNLSGYSFTQILKPKQQDDLLSLVKASFTASTKMKTAQFLSYDDLSELDKLFLLERHLISREHATEKGKKAVAFTANEVISLMVLEEDHLRLQSFQSGFNLAAAWKIVDQLDSELEKKLDYAFDANLGYLTACPTNVGTGLRASCMLHLPGLVLTKQVQKVLQALAKLNLAVRGLYGEGTQATGNLFQFSNQLTLGQQEEEIIENLEVVIKQVIEHEREARKYLSEKKPEKLDDQIWRSLGTLKSARLMTSTEATQLISLLLLGVHQGVIKKGLTVESLNSLFLLVQPSHLQKLSKKTLNSADRDIRRAELIRDSLSKVVL